MQEIDRHANGGLSMLVGSLVTLLLVFGFAFTVYEVKRLNRSKATPPTRDEVEEEEDDRQLDAELVA